MAGELSFIAEIVCGLIDHMLPYGQAMYRGCHLAVAVATDYSPLSFSKIAATKFLGGSIPSIPFWTWTMKVGLMSDFEKQLATTPKPKEIFQGFNQFNQDKGL